jgi:aspartate aminotransferase-like enzyme
MKSLHKHIEKKNKKILFTPGPSSLSFENIINISPCFGRGDKEYLTVENRVLNKLKRMSKKKNIVRMQGSGSFAIEVMIANFLYGNVLILKSGYYSDRLINIAKYYKKKFRNIKKINILDWEDYQKIDKKFDWIFFCYTETSKAIKLPLEKIYKICKAKKIKIMLDATASFGLEKKHNLADVFSYSSCKGLFGLTGAGFISYDNDPKNKVGSFNLDLKTHLIKGTTGPYHAIYSLDEVLKKHAKFKKSVIINKKIFVKKVNKLLSIKKKYQPLLCTQIEQKIINKNKDVILYEPRSNLKGSIVCHLGEVHLKDKAKGKIIDYLNLEK